MAFKSTPEMEEALRKVLEQFDPESEEYDEDDFLDRLVDFENDYAPDDIRKSYTDGMPTQDLLDWEKFVYKDTPWKDEFNGEAHDPDGGADNPVTSETVIDKDDDGDADVTITKQDDGNDDNESLIIGGTDIFKEPFTEEQLAILRNDDDYTKFSGDELKALYKSDFAKARKARNAWIKRARELLEGESSDKPHDQGLAGDTTLEEDLMLNPGMSPSEFSKKAAEKRGAKPGEPAPDFNNFTNDIAKNLASRRW